MNIEQNSKHENFSVFPRVEFNFLRATSVSFFRFSFRIRISLHYFSGQSLFFTFFCVSHRLFESNCCAVSQSGYLHSTNIRKFLRTKNTFVQQGFHRQRCTDWLLHFFVSRLIYCIRIKMLNTVEYSF